MKKKRVVIAMSGGVDSSTAAALLKEEGHEVIGISMQLYNHAELEAELKENRFDSCCSLKDVDEARRVAQILDIPYYVLNFEKIFKEKVVDYFIDEYLHARTPNPCVRCNTDVKFKHLLLKAKELKADYLATGHYVRNVFNEKEKCYELKKAKDLKKDQSYFLFGTDPKELPYLLFPLGDLEKTEVRTLAERHHLPTAQTQKPESMEICFIPNNNYSNFIESKIQNKKAFQGQIITKEGKILGKHDGSFQFTVGQRKGLGVFDSNPLYVLEVDHTSKKVTVGSDQDLKSIGLVAKNINWIKYPKSPCVSVKIRHSTKNIPCTIENLKTHVKVLFQEPERAVTPGQAAVFYEGDTLLGGGWIEQRLS